MKNKSYNFTEYDYRLLCNTCDSILFEGRENPELIAIPWLHVIREHPTFLDNYVDLFTSKTFVKRLRFLLYNFLRKNVSSLRIAWHAIKHIGSVRVFDPKAVKSCDLVFVSHLLSTSQFPAEEDFYFGNLPFLLSQQGLRVVIILINHTQVANLVAPNHLKNSNIQWVIIPKTLSLSSEYKIWMQTNKQSEWLLKRAAVEKNQFRKLVLIRSASEATANSTKASLRISQVISEVVSIAKPNAVVSTYEGHSWERLVFSRARQSMIGGNIKCIGYQHAVLFRLQHASKRLLGEKYDPDVILASGPVGLNQFKKTKGLGSIILGVLGSNRATKLSQRRMTNTCIVLPEGILDECDKLFSFSLLCAIKNPKVSFIWRLHPMLSFKDIARFGIKIKGLPPNIVLSTKKLEEDLQSCKWALYRGSTAIITAALNGIVPIYLSVPNEISIDPLYEIAGSHLAVSSVDQFEEALHAADCGHEIIQYCEQFYTTYDISALQKSLALN